MTEAEFSLRLAEHHLSILGRFAPTPDDKLGERIKTVLLIGHSEPGFWGHFTKQAEWQDGNPDPIDRWSRRVLGTLACTLGGKAWFPFGGPPYHPFYRWALRTGRSFESPVKLLVHDSQGLMVAYRGAIGVTEEWSIETGQSPCPPCEKPCLTACPAGALTGGGYDVPACHAYLDANPKNDCLSAGCRVRRACPVSQGYARLPEQSAYHMSRFHKAE